MNSILKVFIAFHVVGGATLTAAPPNYDDHIRPIFEQSCNNCHNPDKQKGDLDLSTYSATMRGGSGGKIAEPGDGVSSSLYGVVSHTLEPKMPENGDKIDKKQIDLIRAWIDGGLLENKTGKPKKKNKPAFALKLAPSAGKPDGPPPMPKHLLLEPVVTPSRATVVPDMATSPWAPLLAVASQQQVLLYHTDTLDLVAVLPFDRGQPQTLSFHPSGKYLLAGGGIGGKSGTTITWEIETGKEVLRAGKDFDSVLAASLRADLGGVSLGGPGKRVKLWDTASDEQLVSIKKHTDWVTQLAYSPDGILLASGGRGGGVYVWEAGSGNEFHNLRAHKASITGLAWRVDSNLLATSSEDGDLMIWEMNHGKQAKKVTAHKEGILALDWVRSGQLVTSGRDKKVKIWKSDFTLEKELPAFPSLVVEVAFSHDGKRLFCADWQGVISVWDVASAKQIGTLAANPPSVIQQIKIIQDGIAALPGKIDEAEKAAKTAEMQTEAAKATVTKQQASYKNAVSQQQKLTTERGQLDGQLKTLHANGEKLKQERHQKQTALKQAREKLNQHNTAVVASRQILQQTESEEKQFTAEEQAIVLTEQQAREQAEAHPENEALQAAADKARINLEQHRKQLSEKRSLLAQLQTNLVQLTEQRKGPGNQLAEADKIWKEHDTQWQVHHAALKQTQHKRNGINQPIQNANKQVKATENQLKKSRATLANSEQSKQSTASVLNKLRQQTPFQQKRLKHWQAAAVNTEALRLRKEAATLERQQYEAMDAFTQLSEEISKLKDPTKLTQKFRKLVKLRQSIDLSAPELLSKQDEAKKRKAAYREALK